MIWLRLLTMTIQMRMSLPTNVKVHSKCSIANLPPCYKNFDKMRELKTVRRELRRCRLTWKDLTSRADAIVLFGSRALGCNSPDSDVDLLCIGVGRRVSCKGLHVVWITRRKATSADWLSG